MWIIDVDTNKANSYKEELLRQHKQLFKKKPVNGKYYRNNIGDDLKGTVAYEFFDRDKYEEMLVALPVRLIGIHGEYLEAKRGRHDVNEGLEKECIKKLFNYGSIIEGNTSFSYWLAKLMDINTCVYCNRQYTFTIIDEKGNRVVRPQFDHWFPQSQYPEMALSYFNLIPSCALCNDTLKHDKDMDFYTFIHPYLDKECGFRFGYLVLPEGYKVLVKINNNLAAESKRKVKGSLEMFHIEDVYQAHAEYELKDLVELATKNVPDYISVLTRNAMNDLQITEEQAYRMIFGIEMDEKNYLKRPLSKFKHDIIEQIKEAYLK